MHEFFKTETEVKFRYSSEYGGSDWVSQELETNSFVKISNVFYFTDDDLTNHPATPAPLEDDFEYEFRFGTIDGNYIRVPGRRLGIDNDVFISTDIELERKLFAAERNISIFGNLASLLHSSDPIYIGGKRADAVPRDVFFELLAKFPNSYELNRYADARVASILSQYIDGIADARGRYEDYLNKKAATERQLRPALDSLKAQEVHKYVFIRDCIDDALRTKTHASEAEWQNLMMSFLLLLFPKYIKIIERVTINDYYSRPGRITPRYIDIGLVDANGNLDIIEIKRPFENKILRASQYRGNNIPTSELSGAVMQAEKYLFHLSKWGAQGEKTLTKRFASHLPVGMQIRISNPKAIIIVGRDQIGGFDMNDSQRLDFEVLKRKYANMLDIITYDDLLRRLNNAIAAFGPTS